MEDGNATCYCVPDFHGHNCQYKYNDCLPYAPRCMNGGTCIDGVDSFQCSCPDYSSGVLCECLSSPHGVSCKELPSWFDPEIYFPFPIDVFTVKNISVMSIEPTTIILDSRETLSTFTVSTDHKFFIETYSIERSIQTSYTMETRPSTILHPSFVSDLYLNDISKTQVIGQIETESSVFATPFITIPLSESISSSVLESLQITSTPTISKSLPMSIEITPTDELLFASTALLSTSEVIPSTSKISLETSLLHVPTSKVFTLSDSIDTERFTPSEIPITSLIETGISSLIPHYKTDEITDKITKPFQTFIKDSESMFLSYTKIKTDAESYFYSVTTERASEYSYPVFSFDSLMAKTTKFFKYWTIVFPTTLLEIPVSSQFKETDVKTDYKSAESVDSTVEKTIKLKSLGVDSEIVSEPLETTVVSSPSLKQDVHTYKEVYSPTLHRDFMTTLIEIPVTEIGKTQDVSVTQSDKVVLQTLSEVPMMETLTVVDILQTKQVTRRPELETSLIDFSTFGIFTYVDYSIKGTPTVITHREGERDLVDKTKIQEDHSLIFVETVEPKTDIGFKSDLVQSSFFDMTDGFLKSTFIYSEEHTDIIKTSIKIDGSVSKSVTDILPIYPTKVASIYTGTTKAAALTPSPFQTLLPVEKTVRPTFPLTLLTERYIPIPTTGLVFTTITTTPTIPEVDYTLYYDNVSTSFSSRNNYRRNIYIKQECSLICNNGGACIPSVSGDQCNCLFNYSGEYCEIYRYVTKTYFTGFFVSKTSIEDLSLREGVKVYIQVTSESPNGLIAYSEGNADSFFMILLRNSLLQFVFSCGLQTVSFLQGNRKLISHSKTDILIRLWWTPYSTFVPWGRGKCRASLQVNESIPVYSEQESASSDVKLSSIFLGGLPNNYVSPLVVKAGFLPRLRGCISLLEVNDEEFDVWLTSIEGEGVEECGSKLCPTNACHNGGSCTPGIAEWRCICPER
ncbi:Protein eyes shut [Armadillidium vulgare]|nr:Protein eyes shut [Armadillidium vulgare]